jgi:signal transduction histidine kinase/CheY-like chemotaxis protein
MKRVRLVEHDPRIRRDAGAYEDVAVDPHSVFARQIEIIGRQTRRGTPLALVAVFAVVFILSASAGWPRVALWGTLVVIAVAARALVLRAIQRRGLQGSLALAREERMLTVCTAFMGLCIASGALIFFPAADFKARALATVILCAWPAGAVAILGAHPRSYYWYVAMYFPILAFAWISYEPEYPLVVVLMAIFATVLVLLSREVGSLIVESATLEKQKDVLLGEKDDLLKQKDALIVEIEAARAAAQAADRSKSDFLARASHDLRQPFAAITLYTGTLQERATPGIRPLTDNLAAAVNSLEQSFDAIFDLSQLESGKLKTSRNVFEVDSLIGRLAAEYALLADAKGLGFEVQVTKAWLQTDQVRTEQMLRNLLDNALKFTAAGHIALRGQREASGYVITVSDTGPGIPAEEQDHIFQDFYQVGREGPSGPGGLGLGLAIVRRICKALGFEEFVRSAVGQGAEFGIRIPLAALVDVRVPPAPEACQVPANLCGRVVAVIDDDDDVRGAMRAALVQCHAIPVVVDSLVQAQAELSGRALVPHLVLADLQLAEGASGLDAIRVLRDAYPAVKTVVMTAATSIPASTTVDTPVLAKPIPFRTLVSSLSTALESRIDE